MTMKKIKAIKKSTLKDTDKANAILDEIEKREMAGESLGSYALGPDATAIDKMKYSVCRDLNVFRHLTGMPSIDLADKLGIDKSRISEILHYKIDKYSLDTLVGYLFKLRGIAKEIDRRIDVITKALMGKMAS